MKWLKCHIFILLIFTGLFAYSNNPVFICTSIDSISYSTNTDSTVLKDEIQHKRLKAALFALFLGPLGGHRIYLKTLPKIPVFYSVTLGGFGVIALIDLGFIIFTKDLSFFENNNRFIMWRKEE